MLDEYLIAYTTKHLHQVHSMNCKTPLLAFTGCLPTPKTRS